jgi:hypothetical protein
VALDFFGVTLSGRIRQAQRGGLPERVIELWVGQEESQLSDLGALAFVSQINVAFRLGYNAQLSLVLTPPFEDGLRFMNSEIIHFGTGRLELEFGYTTGTVGDGASQFKTLPFTGFMQKPDVKIGNDITITLHALGIGYALNITSGTEVREFEENKSFAFAVKETLDKYVSIDGKTGVFDTDSLYEFFQQKGTDGVPLNDPKKGHLFFREPPVLPGTEPPPPKKDETSGSKKKRKQKNPPPEKKPKVKIQVGPRNDWWFVKETVKRWGLNMFILGKKILIADSKEWLKKRFGADGAGIKHFLLHGEVDPTRNMFPILSFNSPTTAVWLNPGMGKWVAEDIDREKSKKKDEANKDNVPYTVVGGDTVRDPESKVLSNKDSQTAAANMPGNPGQRHIKEQMKAEWKSMQMEGGITAEVSTLGIPSLEPGEVVMLHGFEERGVDGDAKNIFNGKYGITEVRHSVGVGGYQTRFKAISNFYPAAFADATKKTGESEPQPDVPLPVDRRGVGGGGRGGDLVSPKGLAGEDIL